MRRERRQAPTFGGGRYWLYIIKMFRKKWREKLLCSQWFSRSESVARRIILAE
jgi:hypothetical protein